MTWSGHMRQDLDLLGLRQEWSSEQRCVDGFKMEQTCNP